MGASQSLSNEQLDELGDKTGFTNKEILHMFERVRGINQELLPETIKDARLTKEQITKLKELSMNPFIGRLCEVFSTSRDGLLSFSDFLHMMSVFSESASKEVKVEHAFRIYDFDNDGKISAEDLKQVIKLLTGDNSDSTDVVDSKSRDDHVKTLNPGETQQLIAGIMDEADMDGDKLISLVEFQHVMSKSPDFVNLFCIRL